MSIGGNSGNAGSWLPRLDGGAPSGETVTAVAEPDPADDFADLQEDARAAGHAEGLAAGHAEGLARGHAEGLAAGHAEGLAAGRAAAADELDQQLDAWTAEVAKLTTALAEARFGADAVLEQAVAGLVAQLARTVLAQELTAGPNALHGLLQEALAALQAEQGPVTVRASATTLAHLKEMGIAGDVRLEQDPELVDGCRVLGPEHVQEYLVSDRFSRLLEDALGIQDVAPPPVRPRREAD